MAVASRYDVLFEPVDQSLLGTINSRKQFRSLERIGDCQAPGIIAQAVYSGVTAASDFGVDSTAIIRRRERLAVL